MQFQEVVICWKLLIINKNSNQKKFSLIQILKNRTIRRHSVIAPRAVIRRNLVTLLRDIFSLFLSLDPPFHIS